MREYFVEYGGGESRKQAGRSCDYMLVKLNGGGELYAECIYPKNVKADTLEFAALEKRFEDEAISKNVTFKRIVELMNAEAEGRLIVLPCKVGDTVYLIGTNPEYEAKIIGLGVERSGNVWVEWAQYVEHADDPDELWDEGTFHIDDIGKTVFLTLEEAERALEEAQE